MPGRGIDGSASQAAKITAGGERLVNTDRYLIRNVVVLARQLIGIYDAPSERSELRERAAVVVAKLASRSPKVLELVIENAEQYGRHQHIDDAFPYSPNGFEVLARVKPANERVLSYLRHVAHDDYGVAASSASDALAVCDGLCVESEGQGSLLSTNGGADFEAYETPSAVVSEQSPSAGAVSQIPRRMDEPVALPVLEGKRRPRWNFAFGAAGILIVGVICFLIYRFHPSHALARSSGSIVQSSIAKPAAPRQRANSASEGSVEPSTPRSASRAVPEITKSKPPKVWKRWNHATEKLKPTDFAPIIPKIVLPINKQPQIGAILLTLKTMPKMEADFPWALTLPPPPKKRRTIWRRIFQRR